MASDFIDVIDPDSDWGASDQKLMARRQLMYSVAAIQVGAEVASKLILFPDLKRALEAFDRVYQLARDIKLPQGVLVSGPPGSSKTSSAEYFRRSLPPSFSVVDGFGALLIRLRPNPSAGFIVSQLLAELRHPFTQVKADRLTTMRDIAFEVLQHKGTRLVFVDEAQCLGPRVRGRTHEDRDTSAGNLLREMMDRAKVGLVLLSDLRMPRLEQIDQALADRVSARLALSYFENDGAWAVFLGEVVRHIKAIDLSVLNAADVRAKAHLATGGNRRTTMRFITEAVMVAVDESAPALTATHCQLAFQRVAGPGRMVTNPFGGG